MSTSWKTIRVFISSTFKDMQAKCEHLVRAALFATLLWTLPPARASKGDAHDETMALAEKSRKGFKVREDFWSGTCKPGEKKTVKIQLFKGNEYWFWLGSDEDFGDISFDVFDTAGNKVSSEATSSDLAKGVRVTPARTGTYVAVFTITLKPAPPGQKIEKPAKIWWALAYGWK